MITFPFDRPRSLAGIETALNGPEQLSDSQESAEGEKQTCNTSNVSASERSGRPPIIFSITSCCRTDYILLASCFFR